MLVGAIGMILWSRHSDATGERKWHVVIPMATIVIGLVLAAVTPGPAQKMAFLCVAGFGPGAGAGSATGLRSPA